MNERKIVDFRQQSFQKKTSKKQKKKPKNFFFSLFMSAFILSILYFASPWSRLAVIYFEGAALLNRFDLIELSGIRENASVPFLNFRSIEQKLTAHPLVEAAEVSLAGLNRLSVAIQEKEVMACANIGGTLYHILANGQTMQKYENVLPACRGLIIYGLTEEARHGNVLSLFVGNLSQLDPLFVSLVNHIDYEPQWGNMHRFSLSMRDGNTVIVDSHTMVEKLERYQTWVSSVGEGNLGIFNFDVGNVFQPFSAEE